MSDKKEQLAQLLNEQSELKASREALGDRMRELTDKYKPTEDCPEGKKVPDAEWDLYKVASRSLEVATARSKAVDASIESIGIVKQPNVDREGDALTAFMIDGEAGLTAEQRKQYLGSAREGRYSGREGFDINAAFVKAALTKTGTGTDTSGAAAIPVEHAQNVLIENMKAFGGVAGIASLMQTDHGNEIVVPNVDVTSQEGVRLAEATSATDLDLPDLGSTKLTSYIYASKVATVSKQMVRDSSFNVIEWLSRSLVMRNARIISKECTTGTGVSQPQGFMTAVKEGVTTAASGSYTWPELLELYGTIDDAYLNGPAGHGLGTGGHIGYAMNKATIVNLMQLADTQNRPLFLPDIHNNGVLSLFGFPIAKVYEMDAIAAGKEPIAFGNFSYYILRTIGQSLVLRFDDSVYAKANLVGFLNFNEADGRWVQQLSDSNVTCVKSIKIKA